MEAISPQLSVISKTQQKTMTQHVKDGYGKETPMSIRWRFERFWEYKI